jgi:hypothetical protein
VDNTRYLETWEKSNVRHAIFLRPPRFGKSLWLNTMAVYYDKAITDDARRKLFQDLDIMNKATPLMGKYHVLRLDLSIDVDTYTSP